MMHVMHEGRGDSWTLYLGRRRGARYLSVDVRGFNGWSSSRRLPGGWEFYNPTFSIGRLFMECSRSWSREVKVPAKLVHAKRMLRRSYREGMREEPIKA